LPAGGKGTIKVKSLSGHAEKLGALKDVSSSPSKKTLSNFNNFIEPPDIPILELLN
jgi:hypothetical protein